MSNNQMLTVSSDRRTLAKAGAGGLAALIGLNVVSRVRAQEGTPEAGDGLNDAYAVVRVYEVAKDADVEALITIVQDGYVTIIEEVDGFLLYTILYNEETRIWTAIAYFTDKEGSDASTAAAADYVASAELEKYFVDSSPVISDGTIILSAMDSALRAG